MWSLQSMPISWPGIADAGWIVTAGITKAATVNSQTRVRASFISAPPVQNFDQLLDLDLPVALGAGVEGVRYAVVQMLVKNLLLDLVERARTARIWVRTSMQ